MITTPTSQLIDTIDGHKTACEQFSMLWSSELRAGLTQRDLRIAQLEGENGTLTTNKADLEAANAALQQTITELQAAVVNRDQRIAELEGAIADLNSRIDAAQAGV